MFNSQTRSIIFFIIVCTAIIVILISFIIFIVYRYKQKQNNYFTRIEALKGVHKNNILQAQLEMQEQTFVNISREIHDNIGQKLTLAKLHLNVLNYKDYKLMGQVSDSIHIIGEVIKDLSNISRSLHSGIILNNGLIAALEFEVDQLRRLNLYDIQLKVSEEIIFFETDKELLLFRIVQEALNNIIKHASATRIDLYLCYTTDKLQLEIIDNGKGFDHDLPTGRGMGLANMKKRASMLHGQLHIDTHSAGTKIFIEIPIYHDKTAIQNNTRR